MPFVVDTSITMAWYFEDETTDVTDAILNRLQTEGAIVPAIWPLEVANALRSAERRGRLRQEDTTRIVQLVQQLPITVIAVPTFTALGTVLSLGRTHGLTAYDAAYLELAMRNGLPLATQDAQLCAAASRVGVSLLQP